MDLNFIVLFTLFTGGHSLMCYECNSVTSSCVSEPVICPSGTKCASITTSMNILGNTVMNKKVKGCAKPQSCAGGSINFGNVRSKVSAHCCNNYLCNIRDVPDYYSDRPNGKQCYYCDGISCFNKLDCLGTEDHCITALKNNRGLSTTIKGCASKLMCDAADRDLTKVSCCQGNLCNTEVNLHDSEENLDSKEDNPLDSEENLDPKEDNPWDSEENLDTKEDNPWDNEEKLSKKENLRDHEEKLDKEENLRDHEEKLDKEENLHNSERIHRYSERNLRNSAKSITQNLLYLSGPFLSYIIYH
ncbi:urokinase plasminogen activator surface receptor-like isoform X1 [Triplophysa rosa]|uniref:urokinase plasminogen activator surface receptor-like isoform X1 n=1 Tax=Triplophysa rosa TaxID=992332 RepID=UPI002545E3C8|nr:urokinase plasminogen activator surface receptor-like isoform X1 [Triplophysa rosa]